MADKLTLKQKIFVKEYVKDFNGTRAAIAAGYSEDSAALIASENIRKPYIQTAVEAELKKIEKKIDISIDKIADELAKIAFSNIKDFVEFDSKNVNVKDSKDVDGAVIQEISSTVGMRGRSTKLKLHDKMKALELLGRFKGMYKDVVVNSKEPEKLSLAEIEALDKET
jgi:phage terminase small subunit